MSWPTLSARIRASVVLEANPRAVASARAFVRTALTDWQDDAASRQLIDDVVLVVSEMVTNAAQHGSGRPGGQVELDLVSSGAHLVCAVSDPSPHPPQRRTQGLSATSGRGLHLVEALSICWGWTPAGHLVGPQGRLGGVGGAGRRRRGKSVWALFAVPAPERARAAWPLLQVT